MNKLKKHLPTALLILVLLTGLSLLLYPTVSDYWNQRHQSRAIQDYVEEVSAMDEAVQAAKWASAEAYNEWLFQSGHGLGLTEEETAAYEAELDVTGTGIMAYIEVPAIEVYLPIYHGTSEGVLQIAIGHLEGSSLPVGGESTHCVLSGHRGLPSSRLFTDLDELELGDVFYLHTLGETLTYEVDQILTVLPEEVDALQIVEGEDYCTLVTCTPYGINDHRLLVRGHRVETVETEEESETAETAQTGPVTVPVLALGGAAVVVLLAGIWLIVRRGKKRR